MGESRKQFEEWYSNRYGIPDFSKAFENAKMADAFEVWQASRQCIEVELPFYCERYQYDKEIIDSLRDDGIKIKGA